MCLLFEGSNYLRATSVRRNTVHIMDFLFLSRLTMMMGEGIRDTSDKRYSTSTQFNSSFEVERMQP